LVSVDRQTGLKKVFTAWKKRGVLPRLQTNKSELQKRPICKSKGKQTAFRKEMKEIWEESRLSDYENEDFPN